MSKKNTDLPLETWIEHKTEENPFSMHHVEIPANTISALYYHCHSEMELFLVEDGELMFNCANRSFKLSSGDGVFIPPYVIHSADMIAPYDNGCRFYAIVFSKRVIENSLPTYCLQYLNQFLLFRPDDAYPIYNTAENAMILSTIRQIFDYFGKDTSLCQLSVIGLLLKCWQELHNEFFLEQSTAFKNNSTTEYIKSAITYITEHLTEQMSISDVAKSANVSESYLCHSFKEHTGSTVISYINRLRIAKSCEYLVQTQKSMTEISTLCGFNNITYFNRVFKSIMGTTPMNYKKSASNM